MKDDFTVASITVDNIGYVYTQPSTYIPEAFSNITWYSTTSFLEEKTEKEKNMRYLFKVYVVDPRKSGKVLIDGVSIIASNENEAVMKLDVVNVARNAGLDIDDVDYIAIKIFAIRSKTETQKVEIVK